jgi:hypothetical protein
VFYIFLKQCKKKKIGCYVANVLGICVNDCELYGLANPLGGGGTCVEPTCDMKKPQNGVCEEGCVYDGSAEVCALITCNNMVCVCVLLGISNV